MNMALGPLSLCEYCDLQNTGTDHAFCPEWDAMLTLEDFKSFTYGQSRIGGVSGSWSMKRQRCTALIC